MRFSSSTGRALALSAAVSGLVQAQTPYKVQTPPLDTDWTYKVGTDPWPEHPRPQLYRDAWQSLNGIWTYSAASTAGDVSNVPTGKLDREVMIPSCIESGLSGIQELAVEYSWFETSFKVPKSWKDDKVVLNFEAVDYMATVFVNGKQVGTNTGGYFRFSLDVTKHVKFGKDNQLAVFVYDSTDTDVIPCGKQARDPSHIFYRACTGIWQTVWLENVPADHITQLDVSADMDGQVTVTAHTSKKTGQNVEISVIDSRGRTAATGSGKSDKEFTFKMDSPKLWSPDSPTLYNLTVSMGNDEVSSYTGFRTISSQEVNNVQRPVLNGDFTFMFGTLDQGFWPDGLYLPPNREAMVSDLKLLKEYGFNMVRKHIKVEPDLFYQACDEIGLMVIQDMPSLPSDTDARPPNADQMEEFQRQLEVLINEHKSYTSIVTWVIFNEGWGQVRQPPWPEASLTEIVENIDGTRLIDSVTGWYDHGYGDFSDNHHYANPQCGTPFYSINSRPFDPSRIGFQGEFGGLGHNVSIDHLWNVEEAILTINQTYEISENVDAYNYRAHVLFRELKEQTEMYSCSGAVYTQTSDVEGEVNGLITYDRRFKRPNEGQWKSDIKAIFNAAKKRG